jgi:hypothetical protein
VQASANWQYQGTDLKGTWKLSKSGTDPHANPKPWIETILDAIDVLIPAHSNRNIPDAIDTLNLESSLTPQKSYSIQIEIHQNKPECSIPESSRALPKTHHIQIKKNIYIMIRLRSLLDLNRVERLKKLIRFKSKQAWIGVERLKKTCPIQISDRRFGS